jgi:hypothetical protein
VWSLARGDVFKNKWVKKILTLIKLLPVYRTSEGVENITINYETFDTSIDIFKENGIVLIFSEGRCINEWHLRPLKKGTARLAIKAWEEEIPLQVLPVGINYSSYGRFGKNVFINFGEVIQKKDIELSDPDGIRYQSFNNKLQSQLQQLVLEIPKSDKVQQAALLTVKQSFIKKIALSIPAIIGWIVHAPFYWPIKKITWYKTQRNDHYDSFMAGILTFAYPFYVLTIIYFLWLFIKSYWVFSLLLILPFTAWSYTQLKPQLDK